MCCAIAGAAITEARIAALPNNASLDMHFSIRLCQGERRMRNTNGGSDLGSKRGSNSCDDWETLFLQTSGRWGAQPTAFGRQVNRVSDQYRARKLARKPGAISALPRAPGILGDGLAG